MRQSGDDISLGTGSWQGGTSIFESPSATLTLSTTDTDIRSGEPVDIDIDSDIDITDFVASDCTVTNGTRGALTINSATSATLRVTAGSAGTMTVEIAEDAVDPGNAAASQPFIVNARVTATITFDDTEGESGGSTGVNIDLSESVTGLLLSHLTASDGTLSNVTGSGTAWEADLAFPATGSGTVDVDLAIDSTTPQNAAASASIDYAEAEEAVLIADRLYFISTASDATSIARAYDFSGIAQSADDIAIGAGFWQGGLSSDTYIYFVSNGTNVAAAYDFFGSRQAANDISLDSASWQGAVASDTRLYFVSDSGNEAVAYDFSGNRQTGDDISLGTGAWVATSRSNNRLFFVNDSTDTAVAYDFDGNRQSSDDIDLGTGTWRGGLSSDTRIYFVNGTNAIAYDYSGVRQSADDIALGTGRWQGGTTIFGEQVDTVPGAPTSLTGTAAATSMALSWTAPSDDGGAAITDYDVSSDGGTTWVSTGSTSTTHTVSSLDKGTEYTFQVRAVNSVGDGTASASFTETTLTTVPGAPTSLASTPAATSVALTWTAPTDTGGENITDYQLRYQAGSTAGGTWTALGQTTTSHTVSSLDKGTEYTFQVRAVNNTGNSSGSNADTDTTLTTIPGAPTSLSVTVGETTANLSWTAPSDTGGTAITSYEVSSDDGTSWTDTGDADLTYQITGLTADTEYDFKVRAVNSEGSGTASATVTDTTDAAPVVITVPSVPTSLALTKTHNSISATFAAPTDLGNGTISRYDIRIDSGAWVDTGLDSLTPLAL